MHYDILKQMLHCKQYSICFTTVKIFERVHVFLKLVLIFSIYFAIAKSFAFPLTCPPLKMM